MQVVRACRCNGTAHHDKGDPARTLCKHARFGVPSQPSVDLVVRPSAPGEREEGNRARKGEGTSGTRAGDVRMRLASCEHMLLLPRALARHCRRAANCRAAVHTTYDPALGAVRSPCAQKAADVVRGPYSALCRVTDLVTGPIAAGVPSLREGRMNGEKGDQTAASGGLANACTGLREGGLFLLRDGESLRRVE